MKFNSTSLCQQFFTRCCLLFLLMLGNSAYSDSLYYLCGPDEDGCSEDITNYCFCIPYNYSEANKPYCFDFNKMACIPSSQDPNCEAGLIVKNQGECLAIIFQSTPFPPCRVVSKKFCIENHTSFCDLDGSPPACHKSESP